MEKVLVSACLLGYKVRYDGCDFKVESEEFRRFIEQNDIVSFCPEVAVGMPIPRIPAEICGGTGVDVLNGVAKILGKDGVDVTKEFFSGAELALKFCQEHGIKHAVLTDSSPSCGSSEIYNGNFEGIKVQGQGLSCALLEKHGIEVVSQLHTSEFGK